MSSNATLSLCIVEPLKIDEKSLIEKEKHLPNKAQITIYNYNLQLQL